MHRGHVTQLGRLQETPVFIGHHIIHQDLGLKCLKKRCAQQLPEANCAACLSRAKTLLHRFLVSAVDFIFFSGEKIFIMAFPVNLQNDWLYVSQTTKKCEVDAGRLLHTRSTFSRSLMASVAVSKLECQSCLVFVVFVEPGIKVNGKCYWNAMLSKQLLLDICSIAGDTFVFQQDNAPAHRAQDTVALLSQATPQFIVPDPWPPNSPNLNPVDYKIWGVMQEHVYCTSIRDIAELKRRLIAVWCDLEQHVIDEAI